VSLTDDQIDLYSRQIILQELGGVGQRRLLAARCLLRGGGPAFESAATYLLGAGVGLLDLDPMPVASSAAFAPLTERNPDVRIGAARNAKLSAYDVFLDISGTVPRRGRARIGEIGIRAHTEGIDVEVVPSAIGCLDCCASRAVPGVEGDPIDALQAGSMGALAALLWLGEMGVEHAPKRLTLRREAPTWVETALGPTATCPRPCRP